MAASIDNFINAAWELINNILLCENNVVCRTNFDLLDTLIYELTLLNEEALHPSLDGIDYNQTFQCFTNLLILFAQYTYLVRIHPCTNNLPIELFDNNYNNNVFYRVIRIFLRKLLIVNNYIYFL